MICSNNRQPQTASLIILATKTIFETVNDDTIYEILFIRFSHQISFTFSLNFPISNHLNWTVTAVK